MQYMDKNRPIKTPRVDIYNFNGALIASLTEDLPIGVVNFRYRFEDEEDDRCLIRLQANDAKVIDHLDIRRNDRLFVNWGYIGGEMSGRLMVIVRDIKSKYGNNVTWTELECTDVATFLKLSKSQNAVTTSLINYIKEYCIDKLNVVIKESGKVIYKQGINKKATDERTYDIVSVPEGVGYKDPYNEQGSEEVLVEEEYEAGTWFIDSGGVREFLERETDLITSGRSPYIVIREKMRLCPNGPWYVTGRGNTLLIHNRNLGNKPYRSYMYKGEPGDLIDFTPQTKYENFEKSTASQNGIDPLSKSAYFIDSYLELLETLRGLKEVLEDKKISDEKRETEINKWISAYQNGYRNYHASKLPVEFTLDGNAWPASRWTNYTQRGIEQSAVADKTRVSNPAGLINYGNGKYLGGLEVINRAFVYSAPIETWEEASVVLANKLREMEMEKEEANITVEGDPALMIDMVVHIGNVQRAHLGSYYIRQCEHTITNQGFKVTMEGIKVVEEARLKTYSDKGNVEAGADGLKFNAEERYLLEENVFRKWDVKIWVKTGTKYLSADPMVSNTVGDFTYEDGDLVPLDDYIETLNPDTDVAKELIKLYGDNKLRISNSGDDNVNTELR